MSYYRTCPLCGASLDPGERCTCQQYERMDAYSIEEYEPAWPRAAMLAYREEQQWQEEGLQS